MPERVVLHVAGAAVGALPMAVRGAARIRDARPAAEVRIVVQGELVRALTPGALEPDDDATLRLALEERLSISACANSLSAQGIAADALRPGVTVVPAAVVTLAELQWDGWAYLRI